MHLYRETLERFPIFRGKDPQFIIALVTALKLEYYSPDEESSHPQATPPQTLGETRIPSCAAQARCTGVDMYADADPPAPKPHHRAKPHTL